MTGRVPPGQYLTKKFPVLHYSHVPAFDAERYRLWTRGCVDRPLSLSWTEVLALPRIEDVSDFHCVTTWSRLDNRWEGISFRQVAERTGVRPEATHVLLHCLDEYTTNLPLRTLMDDDVLVALRHEGEALPAEHGGPIRLVVPKIYAWKSAKWLTGIEFLEADRRGFWEERGYHNRADPWRDERYSWQEQEEEGK